MGGKMNQGAAQAPVISFQRLSDRELIELVTWLEYAALPPEATAVEIIRQGDREIKRRVKKGSR